MNSVKNWKDQKKKKKMASVECKTKSRERCERPIPGDEIVISGISGKFPKSKTMTEFSYNLYNKVNMSQKFKL